MASATRFSIAGDCMSVVVIGAKALGAKLQRLGAQAPMILAQGTYEAAETIVGDAKEGCPVDTGNLRASGHVLPVTPAQAIQRDGVTFQLGFGGPAGSGNQGDSNSNAAGYAIYVHESGPRVGGVGRKKYLEMAVKENERRVVEIIAKHANLELKAYGVA